MTVIKNENNELIPTRTSTGWHMWMDHQKLNKATRKDPSPFPSLTKCLNNWLKIHIVPTSIDIWDSFKSLSILMTKKILLLHVLMVRMLIEECHFAYAIPLLHFNVV